jgi:2-hydroxychromene-2-carboxylate isomerase
VDRAGRTRAGLEVVTVDATNEGGDSAAVEPIFYFDFSSPYAYLAATRVDDVLPRMPRWVPISMAFVTSAHKRVPWSMCAESREPGKRECEKRAAEYGLPPLRWPSGWPVDSYSLPALRAAYVAAADGRLREFCRAAFERNFLDGNGLGTEADVRGVVATVGLDADQVLAEISGPEVKGKLKMETEKAIRAGVFGVPTVLVGKELFWGDDRLADAASALKAESPR